MGIVNQFFDLKKYPALSLHTEISALCYPLLKRFNYCIFNFIRIYKNGDVFYLCDNYDWLHYYLKNGYPRLGEFEQNTSLRNQDYILWDALSDTDPIVCYSRQMFNIKYGVTLIRPFKSGHDFFNFGTTSNSVSMFNVIKNHIEDLDKFSKTFYEQSKQLISTMEKNLVKVDDFKYKPEPLLNKNKKLYLGPMYHYSHLTEKEVIYLKNLTDGMTVPEVANLWDVSARTVEKHVENIKQKLGCKTQCELGYLVAKLGLREEDDL